jgi:hypothetical protein
VCAPSEAATFVKEAPAVFSTEPITHLFLGQASFLPKLAKCPQFLGLTGLRFGHYTLGDSGAVALSRLPVLPNLRQLRLYKNEIGDRGLKALAKWRGLATVEELDLGWNDFHTAGIKALIASPYLTNVKRLDLTDSTNDLDSPETERALHERFGDVVEV